MSYLCEIEYEIILKDSFWVARNCPKCGRKTHYITTKKFRINANGNKLDVWLIYSFTRIFFHYPATATPQSGIVTMENMVEATTSFVAKISSA